MAATAGREPGDGAPSLLSMSSMEMDGFSAMDRVETQEFIVPSFASPKRSANVIQSTTALLVTMLGGGLLSVPYAYGKAGILGGLLLTVVSALTNGFSLYILIRAARLTGTTTFAKLAHDALGPHAERLVTYLTLTLTLMVASAYMVLVRDTAAATITLFTASPAGAGTGDDDDGSSIDDDLFDDAADAAAAAAAAAAASMDMANLVLTVLVAGTTLPLSLSPKLSSLKKITPLGFASILVLTAAVSYRGLAVAMVRMGMEDADDADAGSAVADDDDGTGGVLGLKLWPDNWSDALVAVPIMTLGYLCHFNALGMHSELTEPTKPRFQQVVLVATTVCTVVYIVFGIAGYIWSGDGVSGDVLNDFAASDGLVLIGRMGLGLALLCNIPLVVLPCRELFIATCLTAFHLTMEPSASSSSPMDVEGKARYMAIAPTTSPSTGTSTTRARADSYTPPTPVVSLTVHVVTTVGILVVAMVLAVACPGVEVIWSLCGSSVGLALAYILPATIYTTLRAHRSGVRWYMIAFARALFWGGIVSAIACTSLAVYNFVLTLLGTSTQ